MSATGPEPFAGTTQGQPEAKQPEREARKQERQEARKQQRKEAKKRERLKAETEEREHAERAQVLAALGVDTADSSGSTDERE
jgi:tellurite resistance protein